MISNAEEIKSRMAAARWKTGSNWGTSATSFFRPDALKKKRDQERGWNLSI